MIVTVQSYIPWLQKWNGEHEVRDGITVSEFLEQLGAQWDRDVLVAVNDRIATAHDVLSAGDQVILLIPLTGG